MSQQPPFELASFSRDLLDVQEQQIVDLVGSDPCLAGVRVTVLDAGESVRITHVLDIVEPRIREDGRPAFPGITGPVACAGSGRTNALEGVLVVSCLDFPGEETHQREQDSVIDLAGPGRKLTRCSDATVVVLEYEPRAGVPHRALEDAVRTSTLRSAEILAAPTVHQEPKNVERFSVNAESHGLPRLAVLLQLAARGKQIMDVRYYGGTVDRAGFPSIINPFEVIDGAVVCSEYHWAAVRNPTIAYQRNRLVTQLSKCNDDGLEFAGVVAMRGHLPTAEEQATSAERAAELAASLGADGVIVTVDASGYAHTDAMLTVRACEQRGIATAVIVGEIVEPDSIGEGLIDWVPEATSVISAGNIEELVPAWKPGRVLGGDYLLDGTSALDEQALPVRYYLGASCQMGDMYLTARTW